MLERKAMVVWNVEEIKHEMQLFVAFQQLDMPKQQITSFKTQWVEDKNYKIVKVHKVLHKKAGFYPLDPMRAANAKQYDCVHQKDKTTNPKQVKRCESCKFRFNNSDVVLECAVANCS